MSTPLHPQTFARLNQALHAFVDAKSSDRAPMVAGPLAGCSIALKDNIDIAGEIVGVGTPMFADRRATSTATTVQRLLDAGAGIAGRTHMVELAFGGWGINTALGTPRNPWDGRVVRVAGGSSSGAAVAVAARMVCAAIGSDSAGSIRMPAALCGITGLKPSFGLVPTDGVFPLAPSYDSLGPMARSAADCARLFEVLSQTPMEPLKSPRGWRMALLDRSAYPVPLDPSVQQALDDAAGTFERLGVHLHKSAPPFEFATLTRDAGTLIAAEAWTLHRARFETEPSAFGAEIRRRLEQARDAAPSEVEAARTARIADSDRFAHWLGADDVLLMPTVHCTAPPLESVSESSVPLGQFTRWVNHVGGCALSLPAGFDAQGLPLAIQLVGRAGTEGRVLALGCAFQQSTNWHLRSPDISWIEAV